MGHPPLIPQEVLIEGSGVSCSTAHRFARDQQELHEDALDSLAKATRRIKSNADMKTGPLEFNVGDKVMLKLTPQIWKKI